MAKTAVIGAGSWGTALSLVLHTNGNDVTVWSIVEQEVQMLREKHEHVDKLPGVKLPEDITFTTDLKEAIEQDIKTTSPLQIPFITHWLHNMPEDKVLNYINHAGFTNAASEKLKIIFVPCYLDGKGGIFNKTYYDMLIGMDATVYPSYYEPWGYTPLESIAFGIPTITTNLAGFGMWAKKTVSGDNLSEGVEVINRTDFNYFEVADAIMNSILALSQKDATDVEEIKQRCFDLARKAEWSKFIDYYLTAFDIAMRHAEERNS